MNLVKQTAKELGLTYKELSKELGYSESALNAAARKDELSEPLKKAIELYLENLALKEKIKLTEAFKQNLKDFLES